MSDWANPEVARAALQDPQLPATELAQIAALHPQLSALIAAHPSAYPELVAWLAARQAAASHAASWDAGVSGYPVSAPAGETAGAAFLATGVASRGLDRRLVFGWWGFALFVAFAQAIGGVIGLAPHGAPAALVSALLWVFILLATSLALLGRGAGGTRGIAAPATTPAELGADNREGDQVATVLAVVGLVVGGVLYAVSFGYWLDSRWRAEVVATWAPVVLLIVLVLAALNVVLRRSRRPAAELDAALPVASGMAATALVILTPLIVTGDLEVTPNYYAFDDVTAIPFALAVGVTVFLTMFCLRPRVVAKSQLSTGAKVWFWVIAGVYALGFAAGIPVGALNIQATFQLLAITGAVLAIMGRSAGLLLHLLAVGVNGMVNLAGLASLVAHGRVNPVAVLLVIFWVAIPLVSWFFVRQSFGRPSVSGRPVLAGATGFNLAFWVTFVIAPVVAVAVDRYAMGGVAVAILVGLVGAAISVVGLVFTYFAAVPKKWATIVQVVVAAVMIGGSLVAAIAGNM